MRNIFLTLSCLFGILLLSGCSDDPATQLEQDSGKIVEQAIIKELNKQIEVSYGNLAFLLAPQEIMLVSSGVNQAQIRSNRWRSSRFPENTRPPK